MTTTPSLTGQRVTTDDISFVVDVWNDDRVALTIGGVQEATFVGGRVEAWCRHWEVHDFGEWVFRERRSGLRVGWGGLQIATIGIGERLTVGYVVSPSVWARGYATEIAKGSIAHAFDVLNAPEVFASVLNTNAVSRRVLEKAGLSSCAEIDHGSHVEIIYSVVR